MIQIKIGSKYKLIDGSIIEITGISKSMDDEYPVKGSSQGLLPNCYSFTSKGKFNTKAPSELDIQEEVK